ncbi:hypothetical protein Hanom_Chr12g01077081 [Helianthus anomalus]
MSPFPFCVDKHSKESLPITIFLTNFGKWTKVNKPLFISNIFRKG